MNPFYPAHRAAWRLLFQFAVFTLLCGAGLSACATLTQREFTLGSDEDATKARPKAVYLTGTKPIDSLSAAERRGLLLDIWKVETEDYPHEIRLFARVMDSAGRFISHMADPYYRGEGDYRRVWTELTEILGGDTVKVDKFTVREYGEADSVAYAIGLALDHGGSMGGTIGILQDAANMFVGMKYPTDRLAIVKFDNKINVEVPLTTDSNRLHRALTKSDLKGYGLYTALYDAIKETILAIAPDTTQRNVNRNDVKPDFVKPDTLPRALVVFTDGEDNASKATDIEVYQLAKKHNVRLFPVGFGYMNDDVLRDLAASTGGRYYKIYSKSELRSVFQDIYMGLRNFYKISYNPATFAGEREVEITVNVGNVNDSTFRIKRRIGGGAGDGSDGAGGALAANDDGSGKGLGKNNGTGANNTNDGANKNSGDGSGGKNKNGLGGDGSDGTNKNSGSGDNKDDGTGNKNGNGTNTNGGDGSGGTNKNGGSGSGDGSGGKNKNGLGGDGTNKNGAGSGDTNKNGSGGDNKDDGTGNKNGNGTNTNGGDGSGDTNKNGGSGSGDGSGGKNKNGLGGDGTNKNGAGSGDTNKNGSGGDDKNGAGNKNGNGTNTNGGDGSGGKNNNGLGDGGAGKNKDGSGDTNKNGSGGDDKNGAGNKSGDGTNTNGSGGNNKNGLGDGRDSTNKNGRGDGNNTNINKHDINNEHGGIACFGHDKKDSGRLNASVKFTTGGPTILDTAAFTRNILFDFRKADIRPESLPLIHELARAMKRYPSLKIEVRGHTDSVGTDDFNQRLSVLRAESVRQALIERGIAPARLRSTGLGFSRPVAVNDSEENRQKNRRTEFVIVAR